MRSNFMFRDATNVQHTNNNNGQSDFNTVVNGVMVESRTYGLGKLEQSTALISDQDLRLANHQRRTRIRLTPQDMI